MCRGDVQRRITVRERQVPQGFWHGHLCEAMGRASGKERQKKNKGAVSEGAYPKQTEMRADYRSQVLGGSVKKRTKILFRWSQVQNLEKCRFSYQRLRSFLEMARNNSFWENRRQTQGKQWVVRKIDWIKEFHFLKSKSKSIRESRVAMKTEWLKINKNWRIKR